MHLQIFNELFVFTHIHHVAGTREGALPLVFQWHRLLVFIYNEVEGAREGTVFSDQDLVPCPDYRQSTYRALKRDLRGKGFVNKVADRRYVLTDTGAAEARRLLGL